MCRSNEAAILLIHHASFDGAAHRRRLGRGVAFLAKLLRNSTELDGLVLVCANCHARIHFERRNLVNARESQSIDG